MLQNLELYIVLAGFAFVGVVGFFFGTSRQKAANLERELKGVQAEKEALEVYEANRVNIQRLKPGTTVDESIDRM